jgi:hypothetical protein
MLPLLKNIGKEINHHFMKSKLLRHLCMSLLPISRSFITANAAIHKILCIVRHGQALHNPRAEAAKAAGCSMDKFLELMRQDDALDAELTELGRQRARACHETHFQHAESSEHLVDLVVSSTLSQALETTELVVYPAAISAPHIPKVSLEHF